LREVGNTILSTVHCSSARCAGLLRLTKTVTIRVEIGRSGKYRDVARTEVLGHIGYALGAGTQEQVSIPLSAAGEKLLHLARAGRYTCVLTISSAAGVRHETISFTNP
jgi:hypothetical protein